MNTFTPRPITLSCRRNPSSVIVEPLEARIAPATALVISATNELVQFDTANPSVVKSTPITGLLGDDIVGFDFRPTTGELFAVGSGSRLYVIDPGTGAATLRFALTADPTDATSPFTGLQGSTFGVDFNPVPDLAGNPSLRVVSGSNQNLRINVNNGQVITDTDINPLAVTLAGVAYTNVDLDPATGTTLFGYDFTFDDLVSTANANGGSYTTVGDSGQVASSNLVGFDIQTVGGVNTAYLALTEAPGTQAQLFTVNLTTGAATPVGNIGTNVLARGLAIVPEFAIGTAYSVDTANNLLRFDVNNPSLIRASTPITGLIGGDAILGMDFRPTTGLLYLVGTANLYTLNPATAAATPVAPLTAAPGDDNPFTTFTGTSFGVGFNPVPDLAGNPSLRVISNADMNVRINVNNGQVTTDTAITGALEITATAYTNVDLDPATGTTIFGYDFQANALVTSANANGGTYTPVGASGVTATLGGESFDIETLPGGINNGYLALTSGAQTQLFTVNLSTGAVTSVGAIGNGVTPMRALALAPNGSFAFSAPSYSVGESGPVATITINRLGGSDGVATVQFSTSNGSASSPGDFTDSDQTVIFGPGTTSQTVTIPISNDALPEGDETINMTLSNPTGGALLGGTATATLAITNDDGPAANAFAVNTAGNLLRFSLSSPGTIISSVPISGLQGGETILGLDFRPATGQLFGLGSTGRLYVIDHAASGAAPATQIGAGTIAPAINGTSFGFDFNPTVDRIRVVSDANQNLRLNPNDGSVVDFDAGTAGIQTDLDLVFANGDPNFGADPSVVASAYLNSVNFATTTTLYGIDSTLDILVTQNPPNNGTLNTVGALGVDATDVLGFDIRDYGGGAQVAYATLVVGGTPGLYTIDLTTGGASFLGPIGGGNTLAALAVAPTGFTATLVGTVATFTGSTASNAIVIDQSGGLLRHNRFSAGDLGFNSDFDFNPAAGGDQTLSASDPAVTVIINGGDADDRVTIGTATAPASGLAAAFQINGQGGGDRLAIDDSASNTARAITISGVSSSFLGLGGPINYGSLEAVQLNAGGGGDTVLVIGTSAAAVSLNAGGGDDSVAFANGASLNGGLLDGGVGVNSLDYSTWTTGVNVDLSAANAQTLFLALLSGAQEPGPLSSSQGSGLGVFTLNTAQTALAFTITAQGVTGATVTGNHIHNAPAGVNGPIVRGLTAAEQVDITPPDEFLTGIWTSTDPAGTGGVPSSGPLTPALVAELLADRLYFNTHTNLFPSGELHGQLINQGSVGAATGAGGARNFANLTGGSDNDILIGDETANIIIGNAGDDTLGGGSDGDNLNGGAGNDTLRLNPLAGTTTVTGGSDTDTIDFSASVLPITFDLDLTGVGQPVAANSAQINAVELFENFVGSNFADLINVDAQPFARDINGGTPSTAPGDRLLVDAKGQNAMVNKTDANTGVVNIIGYAPIIFDEVETVQLANSPVGGGFGPGGGAFSAVTLYPTVKGAASVAIGDVTGDGIPDMVAANRGSNSVSLFAGNGDGTFAQPLTFPSGGKTPRDVALADVDGDLDLDVVVANLDSHNVAVLKNSGGGALDAPLRIATAFFPRTLAVGDLNGDGEADIVAASTVGSKLSIILTDGIGGLGAATRIPSGGLSPVDVAVGDFDGDANFDIVALNKVSGRAVAYFAGNGTGAFTGTPERFSVGPNATALAVADFNSDGVLDLAVNRGINRIISVLLSNGAAPGAQFEAPLVMRLSGPRSADILAAGDFNGDGNIDLALTDSLGRFLRVLLGLGTGLMRAPVDFDLDTGRGPSAMAVGDLNGDGLPDIAIANRTSVSVLIRTTV